MRRTDTLDGTYLGYAYLAAAALDTKLYQKPEGLRIQESTIALRSLCHYRARDMHDMADGFARLLDDPSYPRFDRAVVLTASLESRRARLEMRRLEAPDEVAPDDLVVVNAPDLFLRMEQIMISEAISRFDANIIDTTEMSKEEVVQAVAAAIMPAAS